jgi:uncharacterized membrane protein YkvA (DUF1232 family)
MWLRVVLGLAGGLLLVWASLLLMLWLARPNKHRLHEAMRLLPDALRLMTRLARDRTLPCGVRVRLWLLLGYLALPFDLVPDFVPVIGYADDAVIVAWVLRSTVHRAGRQALARNWPGKPDGLAAVERLAGLPHR